MEQRPLGLTGLLVSALGFGCGNVGGLMVRGQPEQQVAALRRALEAGITYFDTAPLYGNGLSEQNLGRALSEIGAWGQVVVGTKVRLSAADLRDPVAAVRASLTTSLRRLGRDSVDLLQLHNRIGARTDDAGTVGGDDVPAVLDAMRERVREGLTKHVGFTALGETEPLRAAAASLGFETMQAYFNAINPSSGFAGASGDGQDLGGLVDVAAGQGLGGIAIRVMAAGAMVGHALRAPAAGGPGPGIVPGNEYERDIQRAAALAPLARELGLESALELSLRFVIGKAGVSTALVGFSDLHQLESALRWAERGPLSTDAVRRVVESATAGASG